MFSPEEWFDIVKNGTEKMEIFQEDFYTFHKVIIYKKKIRPGNDQSSLQIANTQIPCSDTLNRSFKEVYFGRRGVKLGGIIKNSSSNIEHDLDQIDETENRDGDAETDIF